MYKCMMFCSLPVIYGFLIIKEITEVCQTITHYFTIMFKLTFERRQLIFTFDYLLNLYHFNLNFKIITCMDAFSIQFLGYFTFSTKAICKNLISIIARGMSWGKKEGDLTQSYDKTPYINRKFEKPMDNTKRHQKQIEKRKRYDSVLW